MITKEVKVKSVPKKTIVYNKFRGVDFSTDPSLVDRNRSPFAVNIISDTAGMPEKRLGWRRIHQLYKTQIVTENGVSTIVPTAEKGPVYGLYYGDVGGQNGKMMLAHVGNTLYDFSDSYATAIYSGLAETESCGFFMREEKKGYFFILDGTHYLKYDGTTVSDVLSDAYVPTVFISKNPDGTGGTLYESVNLISDQRCESFLGDGNEVDYYLSVKPVTSIDKVEVRNAAGEYETKVLTTDYTVSTNDGKVHFTGSAPSPIVAGQDNVRITYSKPVTGYKDRILKCTIACKYGYGGSNRVFLSGNPDYKAYDWYSDLWRPDYFPDTSFSVVGDDNTAVMGYQKVGKYLMIIKESNSQDSTIFQRWGGLDENGNVQFYIEQGAAGIGAIAKGSFSTLLDEPLFLSTRGIMAITNTNILAERTIRNRSYYVDNYLLPEKDKDGYSVLPNCTACEWNGYYLLATPNGTCYVLDSKNKSYRKNTSYDSYDFVYESYYWNNIPAVKFLPVVDSLYFGTDDGRICKFNTDKKNLDKYTDNGFKTDPNDGSDGDAIVSVWSTCNDDDGASYLLKSMTKKGCSITIKPFYRSSAEIYVVRDGNGEDFVRNGQFIKSEAMDIFNFFDIDFNRFSFITNDSPQDIYLRKKIKKYKRLQFIIRNAVKCEGFGIYQISKTFTVGNYAKK